MTENSIINLLIVDRLDTVTQTLRDGGYIVQTERLEQEAEVRAFVQSKPLDLVIVRPHPELAGVSAVHSALQQANKTATVVVLIEDQDAAVVAEALSAGADAAASATDNDQLLRTVKKELDYRRLLAQTEQHTHKLEESETRSRQILDNASEAIAYIHEGVHMYANPVYVQLFGYTKADELEGVTLMDMVAAEDRNQVKRFLRDSTKQGAGLEPLRLNGLCTDGTKIPVVMRCSPTRIDDEPCLQIFIDPADTAGATAPAENHHDPLTKLYNRQYFLDYLNSHLEDSQKRRQGCVLYLLLEAYRPLNHRFGLAAGDVLLDDLAPKLAAPLGEHDLIARFGDSVFTYFLPGANAEEASRLAEQLCAVVKDNTAYLEQSLLTTNASVGVASLDGDFDNALALLSLANQGCETARRGGGNKAVNASIEAESPAQKQQEAADEEAVSAIHEAITAERMRLLYQPVVSFADDSEERYQIVMEILDGAGNPLEMTKLAPVAERTNLMLPLDKWSIVTALSSLTERYQENHSLAILFVRVSGNALHDKEFTGWLEKRLQDTGLPGNVVIIEVLEEVAEKHFKEAKPFREALRKLGCGFALASFGGKANSERILNHLTPDYIKLDSELLEKRAKSKDSSASEEITNLTQQAQAMNAQVVAANIANASQMASIWQFGVTLVQGDMVHQPDAEMSFDFAEFAAG